MMSVNRGAGDERPAEPLELQGILPAIHVRPRRLAVAGGGQIRGSIAELIKNLKTGDLFSSHGKYFDARVAES